MKQTIRQFYYRLYTKQPTPQKLNRKYSFKPQNTKTNIQKEINFTY